MNDNDDDDFSLRFPDLTPLIDVIFILIVFFLLTPSISGRVIKVNLPESESGTDKEVFEAMVSVDSDNRIYFRNTHVQIEELPGLLGNAYNDNSDAGRMIVESDKNSSFGIIVKIMDYAGKAGFEAVSFSVTEDPE